MRIAIAATAGAAAALVAASMLGVASAEAPTATPTRNVSVQGVATVPVAQGASAASATAAYRQAMANAVADGQGKAEFLAGKVGATLGNAQTVAEDGGGISCQDEESSYAEYQGEQPDFGYATIVGPVVRAGSSVGAASPPVSAVPKPKVKSRKHRKAATGKAAAVATCKLSAQVSLVYTIN